MTPSPRAYILEAAFCFRECGLYFYRFESEAGYVVRRKPDSAGFLREDAGGDWFVQFVYAREYSAPERFLGRTLYQIFPDRFYRTRLIETRFSDRVIHTNLRDVPEFRPGKGDVWNHDYFGGNFSGIAAKLSYLKELGVGALYLNPIFESHSNHRYDTADYLNADPMLGSNRDFRRFADAAHREDILIILDGVFSHTGADSIYFNKSGRYGPCGAFNDKNSPFYGWYKWDKSQVGYESWWGFQNLPEVDENNPEYREFICGRGGVIDHWISLGADGFRLDVADELPDGFIEEIRRAVKRNGRDKILIGEVWEDAVTKISYGARRKYFWGNALDSVMNYPFREAILSFLREPDAALFMNRVMELAENYPKPMMDVAMNLLATHDTARLITALAGVPEAGGREWQAAERLTRDEYLRGVELCKLAFALLMTLPGLPTIYYGDEIGMQGYRDPFNRGYFRWDGMDRNIRDAVKRLGAVRKENPAFRDGALIPLEADGGFVCYLRQNTENTVLVAVNRGEREREARWGAWTFAVPPWRWRIEPLEGEPE